MKPAKQKLQVYNNQYAKPPQPGDAFSPRYSILVLFKVDNPLIVDLGRRPVNWEINSGIFLGNYDFEARKWRGAVGHDLRLPPNGVPDRYVSSWWQAPETFGQYSKLNSDAPNGDLHSAALVLPDGTGEDDFLEDNDGTN